ncbi:hypothetical protein TREES_T100010935 [Tupaia chinensis]|uniref:Uncharacterized protein n=1 Tax=Tupaia chinensis TaxID=246437 RepID=L9JPJ3_TUPCH|nr:hypothetical protein TREES_T100010935 [Tupaia chinensis]
MAGALLRVPVQPGPPGSRPPAASLVLGVSRARCRPGTEKTLSVEFPGCTVFDFSRIRLVPFKAVFALLLGTESSVHFGNVSYLEDTATKWWTESSVHFGNVSYLEDTATKWW